MFKYLHILASNIRDLFAVFRRIPAAPRGKKGNARILILNWRDIRHAQAGGAEIHIHEMARRWVKSGHEVTLFCANDGKSKNHENIDGVRIVRRGSFMGLYVLCPIYYFLHFRKKVDIILDCENGIPFFSPLYAREPVCCFMFHVHEKVFRRLLKPIPRMIAEFFERYAMPFVYRGCHFITISASTEREMKYWHLTSGPISVIPPGVDRKSLTPGTFARYPLVSYIGRLKKYKSVDVLIKAFALLRRKNPSAKLVIIGSGDDEDRLRALTATLKLTNDVLFLGKVTEKEKIQWLRQSWICAQPSLMEGWGLTVIEANACAVPVVASDVPGLRDSVSDGYSGYLVPHGNVKKLHQKLQLIIGDKKLRNKLSKNAKVWAAQFDWEDSSQSVLDVLIAEADTPANPKKSASSALRNMQRVRKQA